MKYEILAINYWREKKMWGEKCKKFLWKIAKFYEQNKQETDV